MFKGQWRNLASIFFKTGKRQTGGSCFKWAQHQSPTLLKAQNLKLVCLFYILNGQTRQCGLFKGTTQQSHGVGCLRAQPTRPILWREAFLEFVCSWGTLHFARDKFHSLAGQSIRFLEEVFAHTHYLLWVCIWHFIYGFSAYCYYVEYSKALFMEFGVFDLFHLGFILWGL